MASTRMHLHKRGGDIATMRREMLDLYGSALKKRAEGKYAGFLEGARSAFEDAKRTRIPRALASELLRRVCSLGRRPAKYLFIGVRYEELLDGVPAGETMIFCRSKAEIRVAVRRRMRFRLSSALGFNFQRAYFDGETEALDRDIQRALAEFAAIDTHSYLIMTSDTKPVDAFFSVIARHFPRSVRALCVQHGVFADVDPRTYVAEGESVRLNILYEEAQREYAEKYIRHSEFIVMGPPWNVQSVAARGEREVVLVGTGADPAGEYRHSIEFFQSFSRRLTALHVSHAYRPHGTEGIERVSRLFGRIDRREKNALLSGTPKIFVGFASTLMYEAFIAGHTVIGVTSDAINSRTTFPTTMSYPAAQIEALCGHIARSAVVEKVGAQLYAGDDVASRFRRMIQEAAVFYESSGADRIRLQEGSR